MPSAAAAIVSSAFGPAGSAPNADSVRPPGELAVRAAMRRSSSYGVARQCPAPAAPRHRQGLGGLSARWEGAFRFHARDVHLVMRLPARGTSVSFRVLADGGPPGDGHGLAPTVKGPRNTDPATALSTDGRALPGRRPRGRDRLPCSRRRGLGSHGRLGRSPASPADRYEQPEEPHRMTRGGSSWARTLSSSVRPSVSSACRVSSGRLTGSAAQALPLISITTCATSAPRVISQRQPRASAPAPTCLPRFALICQPISPRLRQRTRSRASGRDDLGTAPAGRAAPRSPPRRHPGSARNLIAVSDLTVLRKQDLAEIINCSRLCLDCVDVCTATAGVISRQTDYNTNSTRSLPEACMASCKSCGDEYERHARHHEHCRVCEQAFRRCEQARREFLDTLR